MPPKQPLREYNPTFAEFEVFSEGSLNEIADLLQQRIGRGEFYKLEFLIKPGKDIMDTTTMQKYVEMLKSVGLDIGNGDSAFGYRMPLPKGKTDHRDMVIFRRY